MFDTALYLCPAPADSAYMLNSGENCYSFRDDKGYTRFLKNSHYETLWNDQQYIFRGLDTSGLPGEVYSQFTGDTYGAVWMKRWMNVGDVTERNPDIRFYNADAHETRRAPGGRSWLWLREHQDSMTFPETGATVQDVLILEWTGDAAGKQVIERYGYARGLGLVFFDYFGAPQLHTRFSGLTPVHPTFTPLPNFREPATPPVQEKPPIVTLPPPILNPVLTTVAIDGLRLRGAPGLAAAIVRELRQGEQVAVSGGGAVVDSFVWLRVDTAAGDRGYAASVVNGVDAFVSAKPTEPEPASGTRFQLLTPFQSNVVTARFNAPRDYSFAPNRLQLHEGEDSVDGSADGTVHCGHAGTVVKVGFDGRGDGNYCIVDFGGGWQAWYAHFARVDVEEGQRVSAKEALGLMGATGNATGKHCHLTLTNTKIGLHNYVVPNVVDPDPYLKHW